MAMEETFVLWTKPSQKRYHLSPKFEKALVQVY